MNTVLIIGYVWPEPNSSAAGTRMLQLITSFKQQQWEVIFASPASETPHMIDLEALQVKKQSIQPNDSSFDTFITQLKPNIVVFDRFMMEEQFGWRISQQLPNALKILNTEDLHSLRKTRHEALKKEIPFTPALLKNSTIAKREIASIYRCDINLMISSFEMDLLQNEFGIPKEILFHLPFLYEEISSSKSNSWVPLEERKHFVHIGNFRHAPNWDVTLYLKQKIWPLIRKKLPQAELHIYGSYPSEKVSQLHNPKEGFLIKGWADNAHQIMSNAKICLSPLRFGAGIKGKFTEAMLCGTPSITTTIGAEGMHHNLSWNGIIANTEDEIVTAAVTLYKDKELWPKSQQNGIQIINNLYDKKKFLPNLFKHIEYTQEHLQSLRTQNFIGAMLQHHSHRSTEFMSRWIEEKNKS